MNTVTLSFLEAQVRRLNRIAGTPEQPYVNGIAQLGNFCPKEI